MITADRWQHILGVARQAKTLASKFRPHDTAFAEDMFLLGLLHDFGYEFAVENNLHAAKGGEILQRSGYRHWAEVAQHGDEQVPNMTDELFILNCADMTIGPRGEVMTMDERVAEIGTRHGQNSPAYCKSVLEAQKLRTDPRYKLLFAD